MRARLCGAGAGPGPLPAPAPAAAKDPSGGALEKLLQSAAPADVGTLRAAQSQETNKGRTSKRRSSPWTSIVPCHRPQKGESESLKWTVSLTRPQSAAARTALNATCAALPQKPRQASEPRAFPTRSMAPQWLHPPLSAHLQHGGTPLTSLPCPF